MLAVAAVAAVLSFAGLGSGALSDWDEAIYAEVSKEIASSHHWLTLYWQHLPFFEKPPLSLWIRAALFQWFGVSEFWARFPSALAAVGIVLLTYAIARRMAGATAGVFAAFVLLTTRYFHRVARQGTCEALLCLCIYLAIYGYLRLRKGDESWFYVICVAIATGAMIKGPAILVAPLAIGIDRLFRRKTESALGWREYSVGGLLLLVIIAPWHLWMVSQYGYAFLDTYVGYHLLARATRALEGHVGGPLFYVQVIGLGAFPWSIVALFAVLKWIWYRQSERSLPWILVSVTFVLYTLIPTKLDWYVLPVYPALAAQVGGLLADAGKNRRMLRYSVAVMLAAGMIVTLAKVLTRQGEPLANQMAQLARIAKGSAEPAEPGPLLIIAKPQSEPEIDVPTAVFYSDRRATLLKIPVDDGRITALLQSQHAIDAIVQRDAMAYLSQFYAIRHVAHNDLLSYAVISRPQ